MRVTSPPINISVLGSLTVTVEAPASTHINSPINVTISWSINGTPGGMGSGTLLYGDGDGDDIIGETPPVIRQKRYYTSGTMIIRAEITDNVYGVSGFAETSILVLSNVILTVSASPLSGQVPLNVHFTGNIIGGVPPYMYAVNYGDGTGSGWASGAVIDLVHTYTQVGNFSAVVTAEDSLGALMSHEIGISTKTLANIEEILKIASPLAAGVILIALSEM